MKENDMQTVVDFLDKVLMNVDDTAVVEAVANDVHAFMKKFLLYPELG